MFSDEATIMDVDSSIATSLQITVPVETLGSQILTPPVDGTTITTSTVPSGARIIQYSGEQPVGTYLDILRRIEYVNTEDEPAPGTLSVLVQVFTLNETSGGQAGSNIAQTTINVLPVNDNDPVFSQSVYLATVSEAALVGEMVVTVLATDGDLYGSGEITYEIDGGSEVFSISATSGVITTAHGLDAENVTFYELAVTASDNDRDSPRSSTISVLITVADFNDHGPVFSLSQYYASVRENVISGESVVNITATDNDITSPNNYVMYELLTDNEIASGSGELTPLPPNQASSLPFTIDPQTGEITVAEGAELDYEMVAEYSLHVLARDGGEPTLEASVGLVVSVVNVNDEAPVFTESLFTGSVRDDSLPGTPILTVLAVDADSASVAYSIINSEHLEVDLFSGDVLLKTEVDFTTTPHLSATVIANDTGSPPLISEAEIRIEVVNANNNPPVFSQSSYTFTVSEGAELAAVVNTTDADNDMVTFLIIEGASDIFSLDSTTGELTNQPGAVLDYETQPMYQLTITATDGIFTAYAEVTVELVDVNDNPPMFTSSQYSTTIPESLSPGSSIAQVTVEDADTGSNAVIIYNIIDGGGIFAIDSDTGVVVIEEEIDFETNRGPFVVQVRAMNTEPPFFNATASITITVSDSNDNRPHLYLDILSYEYQEGSPPLQIASGITVTDADSNVHLLTSCDVILERGECQLSSSELQESCGDCEFTCGEELALTNTHESVESTVEVYVTRQVVRLTGNLSEADYQSLLSTLTYVNLALEPAPGERTVFIQCYDAHHTSNVVNISIDLVQVNDNHITITVDSQRLLFQEGDPPLLVIRESSVIVSDRDFDAEVFWLRVAASGLRETERESMSLTSEVEGVLSGPEITVNRTSSLESYQVP